MTIVHLSDLHFGKIAHPRIVDALVAELNRRRPTLVAISGDLTQRARPHEYEAAAEMIDAIEAPVLVVPGNHDVYPWWRPVSRIFNPLKRYRRYVSTDLAPTFVDDGLSVLGVNSAHGRTIKGGRIGSEMRRTIDDHFDGTSDGIFKVLVVHHHLTRIQALGPHDIAGNARQTLVTASRQGIDLILCGHLHVSHIEPLPVSPAGHRVVIASAGTATSSRGRHSNRDTNFFNVIEVGQDAFTIEEWKYDLESKAFSIDGAQTFRRNDG